MDSNIRYKVIKEEICSECNGTGFVWHWKWKMFWEQTTKEIEPDEFNEWWGKNPEVNSIGKTYIPEQRVHCTRCGGLGVIREEVDITVALKEIGLIGE